MKYTEKELKEMIKTYRESLKPDWNKLITEQTPRGKNLENPSVVKTYQEGDVIELNHEIANLSSRTLDDIIMSRRSIRKYSKEPLTLDELSYLLKLTCDISKIGNGYALGVVPTGGARNTLETYFFANNVEGLNKGLYHYAKDTKNITLIKKDVDPDLVDKATKGQLRGTGIVVMWSTIPYRSEFKYSFTAHKMIAMEAGHASQNLYLASESIDCGMVAIAAYDQSAIDKLLDLDGEDEFVVYVATVGKKIK